MDVLWRNLVYSARMLWKKPSLTAVAIIAIGLGIGANTAIFSVVNAVLLQPLPFHSLNNSSASRVSSATRRSTAAAPSQCPTSLTYRNRRRRSNTLPPFKAPARSPPTATSPNV